MSTVSASRVLLNTLFSLLLNSSNAVVNKQSSTKQDALKNSAKKVKKKETKRIEPMPNVPPPIASDTSLDSPVMGRRTRKPPGSWWLTGQDESATQGQTGDPAQRPKTKKTPNKQAAVEVSEETQSSKPGQKCLKKRKSTSSVAENGKKEITTGNDAKADHKTAKKTGGRRKIKAAAQPQVPSQTRVSEEEVGATSDVPAEDISPVFSSHRQHNSTPGKPILKHLQGC